MNPIGVFISSLCFRRIVGYEAFYYLPDSRRRARLSTLIIVQRLRQGLKALLLTLFVLLRTT